MSSSNKSDGVGRHLLLDNRNDKKAVKPGLNLVFKVIGETGGADEKKTDQYEKLKTHPSAYFAELFLQLLSIRFQDVFEKKLAHRIVLPVAYPEREFAWFSKANLTVEYDGEECPLLEYYKLAADNLYCYDIHAAAEFDLHVCKLIRVIRKNQTDTAAR